MIMMYMTCWWVECLCRGVHVEIRRQLCEVCSLWLPSHAPRDSNSNRQACVSNSLPTEPSVIACDTIFFVSFVGEHLDVFLQKHWLEELCKIGSYSAIRPPNLRISQGQNICGSSLCIKRNLDLLPVIKSLQAVYQSLRRTGTDLRKEELHINVNRTDMTRNRNSLLLLTVNSR